MRPQVCVDRRAQMSASGMVPGTIDFFRFQKCRDCETYYQGEEQEMKQDARKEGPAKGKRYKAFHLLKPDEMWTGSQCGCTKPRREFEDKRPGMCRQCRAKRNEQYKKQIKEEAAEKQTCPEHGPHSGAMIGGRLIPWKCPECVRLSRQKGMEAANKSRVILRFDARRKWILKFLEDKAVSEGCAADVWLMRHIAEMVPADWIKQQLINDMVGGES
jgi:hypothetical protein